MTAQIQDVFRYNGSDHELVGISGGGLFTPASLDLQPVGVRTNCWSGYHVVYGLTDNQLVVEDLRINLLEEGEGYVRQEGPQINGVSPTGPDDDWGFNNNYLALKYPLTYTGGLLLAREFINDLYVHMGFHPPWKYEHVNELIFEDGVLLKESDRTEQMAEARQKILDSGEDIKTLGMSIPAFVLDSFDRIY